VMSFLAEAAGLPSVLVQYAHLCAIHPFFVLLILEINLTRHACES
jgi:hypothetical protein